MPCPFQWLVITDGTTDDAGIRNQVDLLSPSGFCILEDGDWQPAITEPKGGGVWRDSQLADGRRPADFKAANVNEAMTLTVSALDQDALIRDTQNLRRLLNKARTYGPTAWQTEPVWIEAQSPGESEMRYSIIWNYSTPNDGNPYEEPFWGKVASAGMNDFTLGLEREPYWRPDEPGTGTTVATSALEAYDGRNLGNVDDTGTREPTVADEVYVANKRNVANITNVHYFDSNANNWSANLLVAGLPVAMLPNPILADDVIVFGIDTTVADSGPFCSLVFDIGTAMALVTGQQWKYSRTGADPTVNWPNLTVQDNTDQDGAMTGMPFDTLGVGSVHWEQPSDWTTQNPTVNAVALGVTGYWVAMDILTVAGGDTPPWQQNRDIYSIVWPYVEIASTAVLGDVEAILRTIVRNQADTNNTAALIAWENRVICGLRSISRGSNFTAYINFSDEQNPAGITIQSSGFYGNDTTVPTGRSAPIAAVGGTGNIIIDSPISTEYLGTFHGYLRYQMTSGTPANATIQVTGRYEALTYFFVSPLHVPANTNAYQVFDLGRIDIGYGTQGQIPTHLFFQAATTGGGGDNFKLIDMILIPVDEWAMDTYDHQNDSGLSRLGGRSLVADAMHLDIDPITSPKFRTSLLKELDDRYRMKYLSVMGSPPMLHANTNQKLWFFHTRFAATGSAEERTEPWIADTIQLLHVAQYDSMRGSR